MPSFVLIRRTVWPQCTNVTDRQDRTGQTDRQRTDSVGRTVFGRPFVKRFALGYRTVVLSVCPVCDVGVLWPNGWTDQDETWHAGRSRPGQIVLDGDPAPTPPEGHSPLQFSAHIYCAQMSAWMKMPLGME